MLHELAVRNLGVIEDARLLLGPGLTALTGETGAGKTLVTTAVSLLVGGRAEGGLVRVGAEEAEVEGRFVSDGGEEVVVRRVIPRDGRARAYVDGRLATVAAIAEAVGDFVDMHGQHGQHALLRSSARRAALDMFGSIDPTPLIEARMAVREARAGLSEFGGDDRARAREIELLRFQLEEIEAANLTDPDEDDLLIAEEALLSDSTAHRDAAVAAGSRLGADGVVGDGLSRAIALMCDREPFDDQTKRAEALLAEILDLGQELRDMADGIPDDPARLVAVGERRRVLTELRRKYGANLSDVLAYWQEVSERMVTLESHEERAAALEARIAELETVEAAEAAKLAAKRRKAAPKLAARVQEQLAKLALPNAKLEVVVGDDPGDDVDFLVAMNSGMQAGPIAKVASGGELSRVMLALQLVVAEAPPTVIFDEVDAGVGGQAATSVGRALANVASTHQVLVVTHLPQVAAFANQQVHIAKSEVGKSTVTTLTELDDAGRVVELSRMLSGSPDSSTARTHAAELLEEASSERITARADRAR